MASFYRLSMILDISVVILYLVATLVIGVYASRKVATQEDYSTGGREYTSFVILATLFASFIGGGFTIGLAEKTFSYGIVFVFCMWGFSLKEFLIARYVAPRMVAFQGKAETI